MIHDKNKELINNRKSNDEQETLFFELNSIKNIPLTRANNLKKKLKDYPHFYKVINQFYILRDILIFFSSVSFSICVLFISIKANYIFILTALLISLIYLIYLEYFKTKYKAELNLTNKEYKIIIDEKKFFDKLYQMIFALIIIVISVFLIIFSSLRSNSLLSVLIFIISLLYLYIL